MNNKLIVAFDVSVVNWKLTIIQVKASAVYGYPSSSFMYSFWKTYNYTQGIPYVHPRSPWYNYDKDKSSYLLFNLYTQS